METNNWIQVLAQVGPWIFIAVSVWVISQAKPQSEIARLRDGFLAWLGKSVRTLSQFLARKFREHLEKRRQQRETDAEQDEDSEETSETGAADKPRKSKSAVKVDKALYKLVIILNYAALALLAIVMSFFGHPWYLVVGGAILQTLFSIDKVGYKDLVSITFFDRPIRQPKVGLTFRLVPWMGMVRLPRAAQQIQIPGEPEEVFHGDDKVDLPPGMVRPFRPISGTPEPGRKGLELGPLNIQMTTTVTGTVRYKIEDVMSFAMAMEGDTPEDMLAYANRQLNDTWSRAVTQQFLQRPIGRVVKDLITISELVEEELETLTNDWGIKILEITLLAPDLSHDLSKELTGIGKALAAQLASNTKADADAYVTTKAGAAAAAVELARRTAIADGKKYEANTLGLEGREIYGAEAAERIIGDNAKLILGIDVRGAVDDMLEGVLGKNKTPEPKGKTDA
ncbi:MAG: hypothetical protein AB202_00070 [Parcubacteria bacterium C7867-007]|nr:MAG: hypothetical protein AB202_00070 [Parcubacteria bacterium C7867-007]